MAVNEDCFFGTLCSGPLQLARDCAGRISTLGLLYCAWFVPSRPRSQYGPRVIRLMRDYVLLNRYHTTHL